LFFMDAMGLRPALSRMGERLAASGYAVLMPNLLYRAGDFAPFDPKTVWSDPDERARLMKVLATVEPAGTMRDVGLYLGALAKMENVDAARLGLVGYCMGGMNAFRAAAAHPDRIRAVAAIHAGHVVTDKPDSPHLASSKVKARLYFACADNDRSCTAEHRAALDDALTKAGVRHEIEFFPGCMHGWSIDDVPAYNREGSERHWRRVLELFDAELARAPRGA
jgi:carboxymethylenebutenolidase